MQLYIDIKLWWFIFFLFPQQEKKKEKMNCKFRKEGY